MISRKHIVKGNPFVSWTAISVATLSTFPVDVTLAPGFAVGQSDKRPSEATRLKIRRSPRKPLG